MTDDITLRRPRPDEIRAFLGPLADAFGEELSEAEFEHESQLLEPDRLVNAFDGEERVGSAGAYSLRLTVPGGEVGAAGISAVGVRPSHRRRGILRQMMDWLLADARARDEAVAVLWATEGTIYQRFGFGMGTVHSSFEIDRTRAIFRQPVEGPAGDGAPYGVVRMVDVEEAMRVFPAVFEQVRRINPGAVSRTETKWRLEVLGDAEWMQGGNGPKFRALLEVDGEPRAYAIYRFKGEWGPVGPNGSILVLEVTALDPAAEQALWQWLLSMDLTATVRAWRGPVPHPLQLWLDEPRRLGLTVADGVWLRIVDVAAALGGRTYNGSGTVVLEIDDPMFDSNAGRWELAVRDGAPVVARTTAEPHITLDVGALASAYLGAFRFADLARAGRARECQPGSVTTLDMLFTPSRAPWCATMF